MAEITIGHGSTITFGDSTGATWEATIEGDAVMSVEEPQRASPPWLVSQRYAVGVGWADPSAAVLDMARADIVRRGAAVTYPVVFGNPHLTPPQRAAEARRRAGRMRPQSAPQAMRRRLLIDSWAADVEEAVRRAFPP